MRITKNSQIVIIKLLAQIVSTYHMFDVLQHYGPLWQIALVASVSLGLGEYKISQEYAIMKHTAKLKSLMLYTLIGLSLISALANVESFARHVNWFGVEGAKFYYTWIAGVIYSASMPTIIVVTSFIKLNEDAKPEKKEEIELEHKNNLIAIKTGINPAAPKVKKKKTINIDNDVDNDVMRKLRSI